MIGRMFFGVGALLFFFAGVGVSVIPTPMVWGLFSLALGLLIGGWTPSAFRKA